MLPAIFRRVLSWCCQDFQPPLPSEEAGQMGVQPVQTSQQGFPIFPPPPPQDILNQRSAYADLLRGRRYKVPKGMRADTPLFSLYRLYEFLVVDHVTGYRNELEDFWHQRDWRVSEIPDPKDDSPSRYAFLACIPALMVCAYNEKIKLGLPRDAPSIISPEQAEEYRTRPESSKKYEEVPEWTSKVSPLPETLFMRSHDNKIMEGFNDPRASDFFKPMNVLIWGPHIHFT